MIIDYRRDFRLGLSFWRCNILIFARLSPVSLPPDEPHANSEDNKTDKYRDL
jgi:hypothetical protein